MSLMPMGGQRTYDPNKNPDEIVGIDQQRRLAAALQQQGMQQEQGQMVSGHYVAPSWTQHLAKALQLGAVGYLDDKANTQQKDYNSTKAKKFGEILAGNKPQQIPGAPVENTSMPAYTPEQQDQFGSPLPNVERTPVTTTITPTTQETPEQQMQRVQPQVMEYLQKYGSTPEAQYLLQQMGKQDDRAYAHGEKVDDRNFNVANESRISERNRGYQVEDMTKTQDFQRIMQKEQQGFALTQQERQFKQQALLQNQSQGFAAGQQSRSQEFQANQNALNRDQQLTVAGLKGSGKDSPQAKVTDAKDVLQILTQAAPMINKSTSSGAGNLVDATAGFFGHSTTGAQNAASLKALEGSLVSKMPKMSGPQSDKDVLLYKQMAGQIGDPTIPAAQKKAAMDTINQLNSRYAGVEYVPLDFGDKANTNAARSMGAPISVDY